MKTDINAILNKETLTAEDRAALAKALADKTFPIFSPTHAAFAAISVAMVTGAVLVYKHYTNG